MNQVNEAPVRQAERVLRLSRVFAAPRTLVFKAWSSAAHLKRWFSPETCSVPEAEMDFRSGGVFNLCMKLPDGTDHWMRGHFVEVTPTHRIAFRCDVSAAGKVQFSAHTTVDFTDEHGGTRMSVHQVYDVYDPAFDDVVRMSNEGWRTTLDKLGAEVARLLSEAPRSVVHGSFTITRVYSAAPAQIFHALTDPEAKAAWFHGGVDFVTLEHRMEARPGGREWLRGRKGTGMVSTFDAVYFDVIPDARLVYSYEMHLDTRKISVSLAIVELRPEAGGTRLTVTEHGAFLDGYDDAGAREHGTGILLDQLGASVGG